MLRHRFLSYSAEVNITHFRQDAMSQPCLARVIPKVIMLEAQRRSFTSWSPVVLRGLILAAVLLAADPCIFATSADAGIQSIVGLIRQGRLPEAHARLLVAVKKNPDSPALFRLLGIVCQREKKFAEAREALQKGVNLTGGKDPQLLFLLCQIEFTLKNRAEALRHANQVSVLKNANPMAHYSLGLLMLDNACPHDAVSELEKARKLAPENPAITTELIVALLNDNNRPRAAELMTGFFKHASYGDLVQAGSRFGDAGHFAAAARAFRLALQINPDAYDAAFDLAFATYRQGKLAKALAILDRMDPRTTRGQWDYHYLRGKIEMSFHHAQNATAEMLKAFSLQPNNETLCSDTGLLLFHFEKFWEALKVYQTCSGHLPDSIPIATGLGLTYFRLGKYEEAIRTFRSVLAAQPVADAAREALGFLLYIEGNLDEASRVLEGRMSGKNVDFYVYYLDALVLLRLHPIGDHADALRSLDEALHKNPAFAPAWFERARIWADRGNSAQALTDLLRATKANPSYAQPYYLMAKIDYKLGKEKDAEQARLRFVALNRAREEKEQEQQVENQLLQALR